MIGTARAGPTCAQAGCPSAICSNSRPYSGQPAPENQTVRADAFASQRQDSATNRSRSRLLASSCAARRPTAHYSMCSAVVSNASPSVVRRGLVTPGGRLPASLSSSCSRSQGGAPACAWALAHTNCRRREGSRRQVHKRSLEYLPRPLDPQSTFINTPFFYLSLGRARIISKLT